MPLRDQGIVFGLHADPETVSDWARAALKEVLAKSGNPQCLISRTVATPEQEAAAIYDNCVRHGVEHQLALYSRNGVPLPGQAVVKVCAVEIAAGHDRATGIKAAIAEVCRQGPSKVSHHCLSVEERKTRCVTDLALSGFAAPENFCVIAKAHPQVAQLLDESKTNSCVHVEWVPPGTPVTIAVASDGTPESGDPNFQPAVLA